MRVSSPHQRRRSPLLWRTTLALALLAASALWATYGVSARTARAESLGSEVNVYTNTNLAGDGVRVPDVIATDQNNVVAAWREGIDPNKYDKGDIKYAYSTDGGHTWSAAQLLAEHNASYDWVYVIFYNDNGTLWAFLGGAPAADQSGEDARPFAKTSTDGGHTWNDVTLIVNQPGSIIVAGRPLKYGSTYLMAYHVGLTGGATGNSAGVLKSTDLRTWDLDGTVPDPNNLSPYEPQIAVSQDAPGTIIMEARSRYTDAQYTSGATYAATSQSTDGGATWSPAVPDPNIPNYNTKGYFTKDANGQYLTIYNTFGSTFDSPATSTEPYFRDILYYKLKKPNEAWGAGQFFADNPATFTGDYAGWDTYAMAYEYAPGKFFTVWEYQKQTIYFAPLDVSDAFNGVNTQWNSVQGWNTDAAGGTLEINPSSQLHLRNDNGGVTSVSKPYGPPGTFTLDFRAQINQYTVNDPATGVSLGTKVVTGDRRLLLAIQADGVYSFDTSNAWVKVYTAVNDTNAHSWRVVVDSAGNATLYEDGINTGATWTLQALSASPESNPTVEHWVTGASGAPAEARVDWTQVSRGVAFTEWNALDGWTTTGATEINPAGQLHLANQTADVSNAVYPLPRTCDPTLEFRGQVSQSAPLDPSNGVGASLGAKVSNGSKRLIMTVQSDGVYAIVKGQTNWSQVYATSVDNGFHTWKVMVRSGGEAELYEDGVDTGASWTIQDTNDSPKVEHFVSGSSSAPVEARVDWTNVTCTLMA